MIFFIGNDGTIIKSFPSPVYQGSVNANNIYVIAPFAENLTATVAFRLPNGVLTERFVMTPVNEISGVTDEKTGKVYSGWQFSMPNTLTKYFGTVKAQFYFYTALGVVVATSNTDFQVGRGVSDILPEEPSADVYAAILSQIAALQQQLDNGAYPARAIYAWNSTYSYGANEITYYPDVGLFGAFVKSKAVNNLNNPPYNAAGELDSQYWEVVLDFNTIKGEQGEPGEAATITVGTVTTGDPGSNATVSNVGTPQNAVFDMVIPRGKPGPRGEQGDSGIGDATLSNIDGDSAENGFTQKAVKGVAQSKNYYNLGAYDTFVSNDDGTVTITRKTGYLKLEGAFAWSRESAGVANGEQAILFYVEKPFNCIGRSKVFCNKIESYAAIAYDVQAGRSNIYFYSSSGIEVYVAGITTLAEFKEWLSQNEVYVEYELDTAHTFTEQVIENQPIHTLSQEGEIWLNDEWREGLNLLNPRSNVISGFIIAEDGKINGTLSSDVRGWNYTNCNIFLTLSAGSYTISALNMFSVNGIGVYDKNNNFLAGQIGELENNSSYTESFHLSATTEVGVIFKLYNGSMYLMLNRGTHPYPYEPYYGGIVRQKELPLFITATDENPAELIGGDWEDKGTTTTSDGTILHVYTRL